MAEHTLYDVAVIGGGLAGLCLSIQCADKGYRTILFEKEEYPFHKVCGEYISLESKDFLEKIGFSFSEIRLPVINNLEISDVSGREYRFKLPLGGFGISRYTLDDTLYRLAVKRKVHVITKCKVHEAKFNNNSFLINSSCGVYISKLTAGSFGKRSNLDVKMKREFIREKNSALSNYIGVKYHVQYPQPKDLISLHNFRGGYCGISAIEQDKCCLCYLTTFKNLKDSANSIKHMESTILAENPILNTIFSTAHFISDQPVTISQISFEKKTQVEDHMVMLGDAAGLITPLCGNGMSMAMYGSKLVFNAFDSFLQNATSRAEMEESYSANWNKEFSKRLKAGRVIQQLFGAKTTTMLFLKSMRAFPLISNKIISMTHGKAF